MEWYGTIEEFFRYEYKKILFTESRFLGVHMFSPGVFDKNLAYKKTIRRWYGG